jgi:hypothetical protein
MLMIKGMDENDCKDYIEEYNIKRLNKISTLDKYKDLINRWLN